MKDYSIEAGNCLKNLTLEEKCSLISGADFWHTKEIKDKLSAVMMSDGPNGLRKQKSSSYDGVSVAESMPSVCYPAAATLANTFNPELVSEVGAAIAEEALKEEVSLLLAPGVNIKRDPLCGRNFEYYSEDPFLSGIMGKAFIEGVQSKGVGATVKHFALNNQENYRMTINAVCDERAKREIYYKPFEIALQANPAAVMCSYNRIDGDYTSENGALLKDLLIDEWGYKGMTVSDWAAVNDRVKGIKNNLNLEMPGGVKDNDNKVLHAVKNGELSEEILDRSVIKIIEFILKSRDNLKKDYKYDLEKHRETALKAAAEGAVLLKNDGILPLKADEKYLIVGDLFENTRYQGSGSSLINPERLITHKAAFREAGIDYEYVKGYNRRTIEEDQELIAEALAKAALYDKIIIFAGLPALFESEGFDRRNMLLPENQSALIKKIAAVNPNITVVLTGGSVMEISFSDNVRAILNMYLCGQEGAYALPDLLLGKINPSGKLAETWGIKYEDYPVSKTLKGPVVCEYRDSIFVGYRYFSTADVPVRYPFGHGLSYTTFNYSDIKTDKNILQKNEKLNINFVLNNTGAIDGKEAVQLYIQKLDSNIMRPCLELKAFKKVFVKAGEDYRIELQLKYNDFAIYDKEEKQWQIEAGEYKILIGASSQDIRLSATVEIEGVTIKSDLYESYKQLVPFNISDKDFIKLYGRDIPSNLKKTKPYNYNTEIGDINKTFIGRLISKQAMPVYTKEQIENDENIEVTINMFKYGLIYNPLRSIVLSSGGLMDFEALDGIILFLNGRRLRAIKKLLKVYKKLKNFK